MKLRSFLFSCLMSFCGFAMSHTADGKSDSKEANVDCREVFNFTFPKILDFVARVDCNQFIINQDNWIWRYPNSYFDRPFISALSPMNRKPVPGMRFFRKLSAYELDQSEIQEAYDSIFKKLRSFPNTQAPQRVIRMDAVNDVQDLSQAWFGFSSESRGWVVICAPDCAPEYLFLLERMD